MNGKILARLTYSQKVLAFGKVYSLFVHWLLLELVVHHYSRVCHKCHFHVLAFAFLHLLYLNVFRNEIMRFTTYILLVTCCYCNVLSFYELMSILMIKKNELMSISGDNNYGDDRLLYAHGQLWLQRHHIMGRAVG